MGGWSTQGVFDMYGGESPQHMKNVADFEVV